MFVRHFPLPVDFVAWLFGLRRPCFVLHCFQYAPLQYCAPFQQAPVCCGRIGALAYTGSFFLAQRTHTAHCTTHCSNCQFFADFQSGGVYCLKTRKIIFSSSLTDSYKQSWNEHIQKMYFLCPDLSRILLSRNATPSASMANIEEQCIHYACSPTCITSLPQACQELNNAIAMHDQWNIKILNRWEIANNGYINFTGGYHSSWIKLYPTISGNGPADLRHFIHLSSRYSARCNARSKKQQSTIQIYLVVNCWCGIYQYCHLFPAAKAGISFQRRL